MKKSLLLILSSALLIGAPLTSCGHENHKDEETIEPGKPNPDEGNTPDNPDKPNPDEGNTPDNPDKPVDPNPDEGTNPDVDPEPDKPIEPEIPDPKLVSNKEAKELASKVSREEKEFFDVTQPVILRGKLLSLFDVKNGTNFAVLADNTGIFSALVNHRDLEKKYHVGQSYEVSGNIGQLYGMNCIEVPVNQNPIPIEDVNVDLNTISIDKTISEIYDEAYKLPITKGGEALGEELYTFNAIYTDKLSSNGDLFMVFDGSKHMIVHSEKKFTNGMSIGCMYEFTAVASSFNYKRAAEVVSAKYISKANTNYLDEMKACAKVTTIHDLYNIDEKDDKGTLYPFIFKAHCYVSADIVNGKYKLALVDSLDDNPQDSQINKRPKAIFARNHVVDEYNAIYSKLVNYYNQEVAGDFYFVVANYNTADHVYQAQIIDDLVTELPEVQTQN